MGHEVQLIHRAIAALLPTSAGIETEECVNIALQDMNFVSMKKKTAKLNPVGTDSWRSLSA